MNDAKFELGTTHMTSSVKHLIDDGEISMEEILMMLYRHSQCDWGDMCEEDRKTNDLALIHGDRLLSSYQSSGYRFYVETTWDRSSTMVMLTSDY